MSHAITAIIAKKSLSDKLVATFVNANQLNLKQDYALIPLTDALLKEIETLYNEESKQPSNLIIQNSLSAMLKTFSKEGSILWFNTQYSGGSGEQTALIYKNEQLHGPYKTKTIWDDEKMELIDFPEGTRAINKALHQLGVYSPYRDEFGALNLPQLNSFKVIFMKMNQEQKKG